MIPIARAHEALAGLRKRLSRHDGQALVEYALILALIAVFCLAALEALGGSVSATLNSIASAISGAGGGGGGS